MHACINSRIQLSSSSHFTNRVPNSFLFGFSVLLRIPVSLSLVLEDPQSFIIRGNSQTIIFQRSLFEQKAIPGVATQAKSYEGSVLKNNPLSSPSAGTLVFITCPSSLSCAGIWNRQCRRISTSGALAQGVFKSSWILLSGVDQLKKNLVSERAINLTLKGTQSYLQFYLGLTSLRWKDWLASGDWAK